MSTGEEVDYNSLMDDIDSVWASMMPSVEKSLKHEGFTDPGAHSIASGLRVAFDSGVSVAHMKLCSVMIDLLNDLIQDTNEAEFPSDYMKAVTRFKERFMCLALLENEASAHE